MSPRWWSAPSRCLADRLVLRRLDYDPEATIVATIGLLYIIQQLALSFYGPEARPVEPPFSLPHPVPWFGYSGYKLAVIAAAIALLVATWLPADPHAARPDHARHPIGPRDGAGLRHAGRPRLCRRLRRSAPCSPRSPRC